MVLLRHLLGDVLRRLRLRQGRTLREVSASARVSLGYLSEVERGQKEASSELLSAICTALDTPLSHVLREVSDNFALAELQNNPVLSGPREPGLHRHDNRAAALDGRVGSVLETSQDPVLGGVRLRPARHDVRRGEPALVPGDAAYEGSARHPGDLTDMVPV
jgi:transcriptional regulator with XRE-family HTH domain